MSRLRGRLFAPLSGARTTAGASTVPAHARLSRRRAAERAWHRIVPMRGVEQDPVVLPEDRG